MGKENKIMKKYLLIIGFLMFFIVQNCFALSYEKVLKNSNAKKAYQKEDYAKAEELFKQHTLSQTRLKELLGHTRNEVFAGMGVGIATAFAVCHFWPK